MRRITRVWEGYIKPTEEKRIEFPLGKVLVHIDVITQSLHPRDRLVLLADALRILADTLYLRWVELYPPPGHDGDPRWIYPPIDTTKYAQLELRIENSSDTDKKWVCVQITQGDKRR